MTRSATLTLALVLLCSSITGFAQQASGKGATGGRVVTQTRLVSVYSDLEDKLETAAVKSDQQQLRQMLTEDFNEWTPEPPGNPVPLEQWMAQYHPKSFHIRQMAVQGFGDVDVVSFRLSQQGRPGKGMQSGEYFVVDVWKHDTPEPKLAARYISHATSSGVKAITPTGKQ